MRRISQKQKVVMSRVEEQDIIALAQGAGGVCFEVFRFTGGQLHDREHFLLDDIDTPAAARTEFIQRYYSLRDAAPPPQITVDGELEDEELLEQWLSEKAGRRVHVVQPQRVPATHRPLLE